MKNSQPTFVFNQEMAAAYDERSMVWAPENAALHSLMRVILAELPTNARILSVGAGTGVDILALAPTFPNWHFTAVEPSPAMLDICRARLEAARIGARCTLHEGFLDTLPPSEPFDGATCLVVSHFILQPEARRQFFSQIAQRLRPQGILVNSDLAFDMTSPTFDKLFEVWIRKITNPETSVEDVQKIRAIYGRDVAVLPPEEVESLIASGGFEAPVPFFQNLLVRAWYSQRDKA